MSQKEEGGGEKTWCEHKACERKDEAGEAAEGETTAGAESGIGQDQLGHSTNQPSRKQIQRGPKSLEKNRSGQEPFKPIPETTTVEPVSPRETNKMEDDNEESWHDANEDEWESAWEKTKDGA